MELRDLISFRRLLSDEATESFGFSGILTLDSNSLELIKKINEHSLKESYYTSDNLSLDTISPRLGEQLKVLIDTSNYPNYYERFEGFIRANKFTFTPAHLFINDIDYYSEDSTENDNFNTYLRLQKLISFLKDISSYQNQAGGKLKLLFTKPDMIGEINIDYNVNDFANFQLDDSINDLRSQVLDCPDNEVRKRLFSAELLNILKQDSLDLNNVVSNWDKIKSSYNSSFQLYLSEFSFDKIKTSSTEYFHELTDRIHSTINKFSGYILAIPVAYILIIRFLDFEGQSIGKDTLLIVIGVLYFCLIWFVLLRNLTQAFQAIENDVSRFNVKISNETHLSEIHNVLNQKITIVIPSQKRKITLVKYVSLTILAITIGAFLYLYASQIQEYLWKVILGSILLICSLVNLLK